MTLLNADRWLVGTLKNDTTIAAAVGARVYQDQAPEETAYPLILVNYVSTLPVQNISADRVMDTELWRIRIIDQDPSYAGVESIADRVRSILHKASGTGVIGCVFAGAYRLPETSEKTQYRSIILEFELFTQ